jgi:hypothetical protein
MSDAQSFLSLDPDFADVVRDLQTSETPAKLYHYTDSAGLKGIVDSKSIWLTHFRYTNDASEVTYGIKRAIEHIEGLISIADDELTKHTVNELLSGRVSSVKPSDVLLSAALKTLGTANIEMATRYQFFVACFSEHGDQLSQWRAYSNLVSGYAIGFARDVLRNETQLEQLRDDRLGDTLDLVKVLYDKEKQLGRIAELVKRICQRVDSGIPSVSMEQRFEWVQGFNVKLMMSILLLALHFKHPGFVDEAEWRLILCKTNPRKAKGETSNAVRTRITLFGITPPMGWIHFSTSLMAARRQKASQNRRFLIDELHPRES